MKPSPSGMSNLPFRIEVWSPVDRCWVDLDGARSRPEALRLIQGLTNPWRVRSLRTGKLVLHCATHRDP